MVPETGKHLKSSGRPVNATQVTLLHMLTWGREYAVDKCRGFVCAGQDAILFASVAVCVACLAQGRFSNSIILLVGEQLWTLSKEELRMTQRHSLKIRNPLSRETKSYVGSHWPLQSIQSCPMGLQLSSSCQLGFSRSFKELRRVEGQSEDLGYC